jgi:hypothetical protein
MLLFAISFSWWLRTLLPVFPSRLQPVYLLPSGSGDRQVDRLTKPAEAGEDNKYIK